MYLLPTDNPFVTRFIAFALVDPMGNIPKWMINKGKVVAPTVVRMLGKSLKTKYGDPADRWEEQQQTMSIDEGKPDQGVLSQPPTETGPQSLVQQDRKLLQTLSQVKVILELHSTLLTLTERTFDVQEKLQRGRSPVVLLAALFSWPVVIAILYSWSRTSNVFVTASNIISRLF